MEKQEWLAKVKENRVVLKSLIEWYHPRSDAYSPAHLPITAKAAEAACQNARSAIAVKEGRPHPLVAFDNALNTGDTSTIYSLLNETWFGVPESTSCWSIPGFSEAVDLIETVEDWE